MQCIWVKRDKFENSNSLLYILLNHVYEFGSGVYHYFIFSLLEQTESLELPTHLVKSILCCDANIFPSVYKLILLLTVFLKSSSLECNFKGLVDTHISWLDLSSAPRWNVC